MHNKVIPKKTLLSIESSQNGFIYHGTEEKDSIGDDDNGEWMINNHENKHHQPVNGRKQNRNNQLPIAESKVNNSTRDRFDGVFVPVTNNGAVKKESSGSTENNPPPTRKIPCNSISSRQNQNIPGIAEAKSGTGKQTTKRTQSKKEVPVDNRNPIPLSLKNTIPINNSKNMFSEQVRRSTRATTKTTKKQQELATVIDLVDIGGDDDESDFDDELYLLNSNLKALKDAYISDKEHLEEVMSLPLPAPTKPTFGNPYPLILLRTIHMGKRAFHGDNVIAKRNIPGYELNLPKTVQLSIQIETNNSRIKLFLIEGPNDEVAAHSNPEIDKPHTQYTANGFFIEHIAFENIVEVM